MSDLLPVALLLGGALLSSLPGPAGAWLAVLAPLAAVAVLPAGPALGRLFAMAFCAAAFLSAVYGLATARRVERAAALVLAAGACGIALAGDWVTLFLCWEVMAVAGLAVTWAGGPEARGAGLRYLLLHALGGGMMLAGILMHVQSGGDVQVTGLVSGGAPASTGAWLILAAALLNAAAPPLHAWLPDAYPRCTPVGSVIQSAFTTKAAVVLLLRVFPGTEALIAVGAVMAVYGVAFAMLEDDVRRLLSYHIVSQVGYMVAGAGMGTALATSGSAAHAFCHILYKALLLMGAGAVVHAAGTGKLSELGGLFRRMPWVFFLYMAGALAISGAPPFNGFVSKSLVVAASQADAPGWAATLLHLASVGTFLSVGLKLPYFAFFAEGGGAVRRPVPAAMLAAMALGAAACLLTGVFPSWLYARLPEPPAFEPYSPASVLGALALLAGTAAVFGAARRLLAPKGGFTLDVDQFYRRPAAELTRGLSRALTSAGAALRGRGEEAAAGLAALAVRPRRRPAAVGEPLSWLAAAFVLALLAARLRG